VSSLVVRTVPMPVATLVTIAGEVCLATVGEFRKHLLAVSDCHTVLEMSDMNCCLRQG
jgi:hypothetical protein